MECSSCSSCPSCRLTVSSRTGRLRWCVAEKGGQRRVRWVLTATVLVLVVCALVAIAILRLVGEYQSHAQRNVIPRPAPRAFNPEDAELHERTILEDGTTWFLPEKPPPQAPVPEPLRGRRATSMRGARGARGALWNNSAGSEVIWPSERTRWNAVLPQGQQGHVQWAAVKPSSRSSNDKKSSFSDESFSGQSEEVPALHVHQQEHVQQDHQVQQGHEVQQDQQAQLGPGRPKSLVQQVVKEVEANDLPVETTTKRPEEDITNGTATDKNSGAHQQQPTLIPSHEGVENFFQDIWRVQGDAASVREARAKMMLKYMDQNVDPCEDFYTYACGGWARAHPIPPDKVAFDTFEMLRETLDAALRGELEDLEDLSSAPVPQPVSPQSVVPVSPSSADLVSPPSAVLESPPPARLVSPASDRPGSFPPDLPGLTPSAVLATPTSFDSVPSPKGGVESEPTAPAPHRNATTKSSKPVSAILKAKWLYKSCMDHDVLESRGVAPLLELLSSLGGWPILDSTWNETSFDWVELMAQLRLYNNDILVSEWVGPDVKNSDQYVIQLDQTGLGLPTRDYYLMPANAPYLRAYRSFMLEVATTLGAEPERAARHVDEIVEFETSLAQIVASAEERRNVTQLYQRLSLAELVAQVPRVDWRRYLSIVMQRTVSLDQPIVIFALNYMNDLVSLLGRVPTRVVSNYLLWRFVRHRINNLDDRFSDAKQRLFHVLVGREAVPPRWKTCVSHVNAHMGMAVGAMFVRKYFDHNSKLDTLEMTHEIMQSFRETLNSTDWIDEDTRLLALHKVDSMLLRIGYPDFLLDNEALDERYEDVDVHPGKYFENTLNILKKLTRVEQDRLGTPVNKTLWNTAPAVVNAYYSRNKNQIMFPAGILQPPFYHRHLPRSLNYGGIGVVIGHEITHGFDDKGRLFDEHGNLMRWWGDEAIDNFHSRAQCLIDQYSRYTVSEIDLIINGENTQGENIADNGGIKQAFRAYERWRAAHGDARETLPGVNASSKQLFFLNFAQVWCGSMRPEAMRNKLKIAVHSPARFRVIGTLSNSKEFAEVFNCSLGSAMNPGEKCSVW